VVPTRIIIAIAITRDRAVEAYKRRGIDVAAFSFTEPLRRIRRQKWLEQTNARDDVAVGKLEVLNESLADHEKELHDVREQARDARDRLAAEQVDVEAQLRASQQALAAFEERLRLSEQQGGGHAANVALRLVRGQMSFSAKP